MFLLRTLESVGKQASLLVAFLGNEQRETVVAVVLGRRARSALVLRVALTAVVVTENKQIPLDFANFLSEKIERCVKRCRL